MPEVSETTVILPSSGMASAAVAPLPWVGGVNAASVNIGG